MKLTLPLHVILKITCFQSPPKSFCCYSSSPILFYLFAVQIDIFLVIVSSTLLHNILVTSILCMRKLPSLQLVAINLRVIGNFTLADIVLIAEKVTFHKTITFN